MTVLPRLAPRVHHVAAALLLLAVAMPGPPATARAETLADLTFSMLQEVKRLRGLEPKRTVGIGQRSPDDLRTLLHQRIMEEYTAEQLTALQRLLALTGLIPADYDLIGRYVALMSARALGYYDFPTNTFFLSTTTEAPLRASVVLHELTHALQDQHFFIHRRLKALKANEDARTALTALLEGEATALMLEHLLKLETSEHRFYTMATDRLVSNLGDGGEAFKSEPPVMRDLIFFPYDAGLPFIRAVRRRRPWSGIDALYKAPPASTEQVLHPERFLVTPDPPRSVRWPPLPRGLRDRWRRLDVNTMGELGAYLLVKYSSTDAIEAREAAAGWGGDRYLVLEDPEAPGRSVAIMAFVWDTERDADEFAEAYRRGAAARPPTGAVAPRPGGLGWMARRPQGLTVIERRGERVLILEGVPPETLEPFLAYGWSARVSPPPASGPPPTAELARREALRRQAEVHLEGGELANAAHAARQAVALSADDAEARYLLGSILIAEQATFAEGFDHLKNATTLEPSFGPAHFQLGQLLTDQGLIGEARPHLERAHAIMPDHRSAAVAYAALLLEAGEAEAASRVLRPWAEGPGQDPALLSLLGEAALARGDRTAARRHLTAALRLGPSVTTHRALGVLERKEGNLEAAEHHLKKASALDPTGTAALVALGDLYLATGQEAKAEATIRAAVARNPLDPAPATHLGQLALVASDRTTAEAWFTQALTTDPRWRPAIEGLIAIRSKDGRPTGRLKTLLDHLATVDDAVRKAVRIGRTSLEKGLLKHAREQFEKAARLDGDHPGAWAGLGRVHEREERFDLAARAYIKALSSPDPMPPAVRNRLLQWVASRRHPDAFQPVLKRFLHATDDGERQRAVLALGALGDQRVVPLLVDHLERHSPPVQAAVAEALGRLGDPAAAGPLERLAATSQNEEVRSAVQRALDRLPRPRTR